ncbi:MAG: FHA domain-containing protein [Acetatifactor sp.]|nr:FHA domain-containing protein [Acetatifactor sp.]
MGDECVKNEKDMSLSCNGAMVGVRGEYQGITIPVGRGISLGRDPLSAQLVISNQKVSRQHCTITFEEETGTYYVLDYSQNGVMRENGARMPAGEMCCFSPGDVIYIGNVDTAFRFV